MSKIGKKPVQIPEGAEAQIKGNTIELKGKLGSLVLPILPNVIVEVVDNQILVKPINDSREKQTRANWGTMRALISNAVSGVSSGFIKVLEIEGIGFKANLEGQNLVLNIGFTHSVKFPIPSGITVTVDKAGIKISGIDKCVVGETAASIRALKKPEPYKGTGIRYKGEVIRRKAGKKVAGAGVAAA